MRRFPARLMLTAGFLLVGTISADAATPDNASGGNFFVVIGGLVVLFVGLSMWRRVRRDGVKGLLETALRFVVAVPGMWVVVAGLHGLFGVPPASLMIPLWLGLVAVMFNLGRALVPRPIRKFWAALFSAAERDTHGTARFGTARDAERHRAPASPADAFVLGTLRDGRGDRRFRQDGHILTCAPTGAGKGVGGVIPNLLDYPGSAFVLDFKGENYAVTARARRALHQDVFLVDPFGITGARAHSLNWLDMLDPDHPDVVSQAGGLADMLVVSEGANAEPHWNDTARDLLRGLLVYVAGLPAERRTMAEVRRIVTAPENDLADTLADMLADPERGQRLPARAAATHLNRPDRERGSVLSTVVRHTAWLDDPRLCAALARSDFSLRDLKRRPMTVYIAIPPDRLRVCLGFVRGFIGLALDGITAIPDRPAHRVGFYLDEFGQLGRMDRLADAITLLRGYGAQLWIFVQDLSQLKAVYPRWQSFLANATQQFFGTADYDTARYLSGALGQQTILFRTQSSSTSDQSGWNGTSSVSNSTGEHIQGRPLLTPDEVMRLGAKRPIVLVAGEPAYLLDRVNYLTDPAYAGRFDANPLHLPRAAE